DAQLRAVADAGRDAQPDLPLGLDRATSRAARACLLDARWTGLDLDGARRDPARHAALSTRPAAVLALRVRKAERAAAHAGCTADDRVEGDHPPRALLGLEAAHLELGVDVLAADDLRGACLPQRLVEALVPPAAIAVAVVQEARLVLRQHRVGLGELPEAGFRVRRVRDVRVPVAREGVEGAADRLS